MTKSELESYNDRGYLYRVLMMYLNNNIDTFTKWRTELLKHTLSIEGNPLDDAVNGLYEGVFKLYRNLPINHKKLMCSPALYDLMRNATIGDNQWKLTLRYDIYSIYYTEPELHHHIIKVECGLEDLYVPELQKAIKVLKNLDREMKKYYKENISYEINTKSSI